jgi:hypothetical protein
MIERMTREELHKQYPDLWTGSVSNINNDLLRECILAAIEPRFIVKDTGRRSTRTSIDALTQLWAELAPGQDFIDFCVTLPLGASYRTSGGGPWIRTAKHKWNLCSLNHAADYVWSLEQCPTQIGDLDPPRALVPMFLSLLQQDSSFLNYSIYELTYREP